MRNMNILNHSQQLQQELDHQVLLNRVTKRIRQSLELQEILTATVAEVRSFLQTDRVKIYKFDEDGSGEVIAESIHGNRLPVLKGLRFPEDDIPAEARRMYDSLRIRTIVDVTKGLIGFSPLEANQSDEFPSTEIYYREVDSCHLAYLTAMGVKSSLVVPILHEKIQPKIKGKTEGKTNLSQLWGLLVSHHSEPRQILESDLQVVQLVVDQLSIAIAQSTLLEQTRQQGLREATVNQVASLLHEHPTIQLQAALEATVQALQGIGGRLSIFEDGKDTVEVLTWGTQPVMPNWGMGSQLEEHPLWQKWLREGASSQALDEQGLLSPVVAITDLYKEPRFRILVPVFQFTRIRGVLLLPILYRQHLLGGITIFRPEIETETLWAGRFDPNGKQILPRKSFEAWQQLKRGQSQPWIDEEIALAQALVNQLSMGIQQYLLYKQIKTLNINLEQQVQHRTEQLQKSLDVAKAKERITAQIRRTLDLKTTLSTLVREVRALLGSDRVIIFQLNNQREGEVVVEDVCHVQFSILGMKTSEERFPEESAQLYRKGRTRAINDIYREEITLCHREFLENISIRANLVVPIGLDSYLWGLLIAHECQSPRNWTEDEVNLLKQLADQAAIAISQAELYEQSRTAALNEQAKAKQLATTLDELRKTQSQLIQTEKMSGLGRLVAGVAHEINNPINFIFGNLSYTTEYSEHLLHLLKLYQKYYPNPAAEIEEYADSIEINFVTEDLPKILSSMQMGAQRIRQLVLSLRNFSRLDQADMKAVDIHEGLESSILILQHRLNSKANSPNIKVIKKYSPLPPVECYAGLLNQVFMNILSNGIDALESNFSSINLGGLSRKLADPVMTISTSLANCQSCDERILISISDNGTGIAPDVLPHIFDPFFTTKPVGQGTGLGLAISYQIIVEQHKGTLECSSEWGQGTEFRIEIPVRQSTPSVASSP